MTLLEDARNVVGTLEQLVSNFRSQDNDEISKWLARGLNDLVKWAEDAERRLQALETNGSQ